MPKEVFIYDAVRIPTGKKGGYYKNILVEELTAHLINKLLLRNLGLKDKIEEILFGNSIGTMGNMSRYAALKSSLPNNILSSTVDIQCGGAYQALRLGKALIASGERTSVLTGGLESNSLMPSRFYNSKDPRYTEEKHINQADFSPIEQISLRKSAENLALKYEITKAEMAEWVLSSHSKANSFSQSQAYAHHVIGYEGYPNVDQTLREDLTIEKLNALSEDLLIDRTNTADFHDGAGILLLSVGQELNAKPLAKIVDVEISGIDPNSSPEGCISATEKLLSKRGISIAEIDLFEVNESFACKPLAFAKHFNVNLEKINILGGNLAMGHPYAASGVINMINLICGLKLKNKKFGLVSAGVAGGFGAAVLIENIK